MVLKLTLFLGPSNIKSKVNYVSVSNLININLKNLCAIIILQVMDEIAAMEQNIAMLKKAIADKEAPMKVSQTRLENRTFRPNVELCRDRVQYRLLEEVFEISTNIERLHEKLADAEASLKGLIRKQLSLEEDIEVKANSLFIDRDQCMELRKQINHVSH